MLCFLVIEQLPVELRDRFTDMREMDLQVQSKWIFESKKFNLEEFAAVHMRMHCKPWVVGE